MPQLFPLSWMMITPIMLTIFLIILMTIYFLKMEMKMMMPKKETIKVYINFKW
ncbi:ATP synthase F0 subunit 8 (mitochondrion) [Amblyomma americanum]|uniref:ATP synthase subunit 8 n=1 Tax=Amblyomma americanum TaxID=6943 RepID=A0A0K0PR22_AMBAM|nr:ATP synthase F0 subunit 8 [Amblyomma americanum]AKQ50893.1 ATP synthase subunit 8 [Amblyomma americanum]AKT08846.1 ATPase subunit 8 [Amblyomma americanum]UKT60465.1 ATP synthase subunit 8 [Amblyomma americanum]UKT60478.1 ATP synthase subunit 8 [Amblyomma americanum]